MIVNDNIKIIRKLLGKKQSIFAAELDISLSNLKSYENMEVCPKLPVLLKISVLTGISLESLQTTAIDPSCYTFPGQDKKDKFVTPLDHVFDYEENDLQQRDRYIKMLESNDRFFKDQFTAYGEVIIANLSTLQKQGSRIETLLKSALRPASGEDESAITI